MNFLPISLILPENPEKTKKTTLATIPGIEPDHTFVWTPPFGLWLFLVFQSLFFGLQRYDYFSLSAKFFRFFFHFFSALNCEGQPRKKPHLFLKSALIQPLCSKAGAKVQPIFIHASIFKNIFNFFFETRLSKF